MTFRLASWDCSVPVTAEVKYLRVSNTRYHRADSAMQEYSRLIPEKSGGATSHQETLVLLAAYLFLSLFPKGYNLS